MRLMRLKGKNTKKLIRLAILANAVQIACALAIFLRVVFSGSFNLPDQAEIVLVAFACAVVIWGAVVDIRDAFITREVDAQRSMLEDAYRQLEDLNRTLRQQRHDFKNHLQVVYSLTEMRAYDDVQDYVQRIYEDVQSVGSLIRTAVPAVNALLSAKASDCRERGIRFDVELQSAWEDMPVAGWEMCRIIGNLVDNAMDALKEGGTPEPRILVTIGESIPAFTLSVENNGPEIPSEHRRSIFLPGFTTKSEGHGNGLSIVSSLVEDYGGRLELQSDARCTRFSYTFPRSAKAASAEE